MREIGLSARELELLDGVFRRYPDIQRLLLYGSRAIGTHNPQSDIDLALIGVKNALEVEGVALELDELPLPYRFDVRAFEGIRNALLRAHIERVGKSLP
jgi:predicted nucleotidyltransferase